jgi:rRNA-processing protein FCF1
MSNEHLDISEAELRALRSSCLSSAFMVGAKSLDEAIEISRKMVDYIVGTNDAEIIRAARELADKAKS